LTLPETWLVRGFGRGQGLFPCHPASAYVSSEKISHMNEEQLEVHDFQAFDETGKEPPPARRPGGKMLVLAVAAVALAIVGTAWMAGRLHAVPFTTTYQAVLLINGQVYFGRLGGYGTSDTVLTEVYYV
jgi:hypothetical protein